MGSVKTSREPTTKMIDMIYIFYKGLFGKKWQYTLKLDVWFLDETFYTWNCGWGKQHFIVDPPMDLYRPADTTMNTMVTMND